MRRATDIVQIVPVRAPHIHDDHIGPFARDGLRQGLTRARPHREGGASRREVRLNNARPLGFGINQQNLQLQ